MLQDDHSNHDCLHISHHPTDSYRREFFTKKLASIYEQEQLQQLFQDFITIAPLTEISSVTNALIKDSSPPSLLVDIVQEIQPSLVIPPARNASAIEIFTAYALEDEPYKQRVERILSTLKRQRWRLIYHWREVAVDDISWRQDNHLETAHLILLLVSSAFSDTEFCYSQGIIEAVRKHEKQTKCHIIPIIVRPDPLWRDTPFGHLPCLPKNGKAISQCDIDEAFGHVATYIKEKIQELQYYA
ncbi:MAG TPA: hypothetical protein VFB60_02465 [Ktedonobacteraceae bacterium]|nr:hypothetical protein [Ktedonobacteraceae bacterium]